MTPPPMIHRTDSEVVEVAGQRVLRLTMHDCDGGAHVFEFPARPTFQLWRLVGEFVLDVVLESPRQ